MTTAVLPTIVCKLCRKRLRRITNTHLWVTHRLSIQEYRQRFPGPIDAPGLIELRTGHHTGKTYEQIYGKGEAARLKNLRSAQASAQMLDPDQIRVRENKCGRFHLTKEIRDKMSAAATKHGATTYRRRALAYYGQECARCGFASENPRDFHVHHKDLINVGTELADHSLENLMVLCKTCHKRLHNEHMKLSRRLVGEKAIETGVHHIFRGLKHALGLKLHGKNFRDTPKRIARAYLEIFEGVPNTGKQVKEILSATFPCQTDELILVRDIRAFSMCPHHLLPVDYTIHAGYIPSKDGNVLGISKLGRLVTLLAKRPILQEKLTEDITLCLMTIPGCAAAGCVVIGKHYCMMMRGVGMPDCQTVTSSLRGAFRTNASARAEFLRLAYETRR